MYGTRSPLLKSLVFLAVLAAAVLFVRMKKDTLVREGADFLQALLSRETKLDIRIGNISGRITGVIRFDDVVLEDPNLPEGLRVLFRAKRVEFRYQLWEFLTKNFNAKIDVHVKDPEVYWRPAVRQRPDPFPMFKALRGFLISQRQRFGLHVRNLTVHTGEDARAFDGIALDYADDRFSIDVPVRHLPLDGNDLSTELKLRGRFEWGPAKGAGKLIMEMYTEGSVVNLQPLPWESRFDLTVTPEGVQIDNSTFLGGFQLTGEMRFNEGDPTVDFSLRAQDYPLKNLEPFLGRMEPHSYDGSLSLEAHFRGPLEEPSAEINARIDGGKFGKSHYRSMTLHASGVYPTLTLSDSHVLMEDGVQMRFADQTLEFRELFNSHTYRTLITATTQENASLGDWGFRRPMDANQQSEFLMERSVGPARLQLRKYNETEQERQLLEPAEERNGQDVEMGVEFHLLSDNKLKYTVREDEQFLGVERKLSF